MRRIVDSRWFGLADLVCAVGSVALLSVQPSLGGWPLLLAGAPWGLRLLARRFPFQRTPFDFFLLLFLITAGIGVWAAYDPAAAERKFYLLANGVLLYYALAGQPRDNQALSAGALCGLGVILTANFLLTTNWPQQLSDFAFINQFTEWLSGVRPTPQAAFLNRNTFAGQVAMLFPFCVAVGFYAWGGRRWFILFAVLAAGAFEALAMLISSSRGAWSALAIGLAVWVLGAQRMRPGQNGQRIRWAWVLSAVLAIAGIVVFVYPNGWRTLASRFMLVNDTSSLVSDFLLFGGGLVSFSGLYSRYVLAIPFFVFDYSHNFLWDVLLEQGILGALALAGVYAGSLWLLWKKVKTSDDRTVYPWRWATLSAFVVVLLHGLIDDALYAVNGTAWVFVLPGLAVMLTREAPEVGVPHPATFKGRVWWTPQVASLVATVVIIGLFVGIPSLRARLYANLGSVEMARVELAGWPEERWDRTYDPLKFEKARLWFEDSLALDPANPAALYRLGLLAYQEDDLDLATARLEQAFVERAMPRGPTKILGYLYTWQGEFGRAGALLVRIPEARYELGIYSWWWGTQGRDDLARNASDMEVRLGQLGMPVTSDPTTLNFP